ncbi:MAG: hypothetical protein EXR29_02475 [Betaproteobacteria bacterium]|nr:hypothetical protein [Betaproteobacteria bacterium]
MNRRDPVLAWAAIAMFVAACGPSGSPAYQANLGLMSASLNGDCSGMYARVENWATEYVDNLCKPRSVVLMGKIIELGSPASIIAQMGSAATPFAPPVIQERTIESETASADGLEVRLVVTEKSFERNGNLLAPTWLMRHRLAVRNTGISWKINRFSEEVLEKYGDKARK